MLLYFDLHFSLIYFSHNPPTSRLNPNIYFKFKQDFLQARGAQRGTRIRGA